jgi:hypothetical protein
VSIPVFSRAALNGWWKSIDSKEVWWEVKVWYGELGVGGLVVMFRCLGWCQRFCWEILFILIYETLFSVYNTF